MKNYKITFDPIKPGDLQTVLVTPTRSKQSALLFARTIAADNENLPKVKRVLGQLVSVEPTDDEPSSEYDFFLLGRRMGDAKRG